MADNELNVQVSDDGYEASLKEAIRLNKELESQLFKTANILKSNNAEYRSAYTQLTKYVNAINNLNAKINQGGNQSKTKDKPKQNDFNKEISTTVKLNKQLENQLNRTSSAMRSATDEYGKATNKLKDLNSELKSLHDNLGGKTNMNINVNSKAKTNVNTDTQENNENSENVNNNNKKDNKKPNIFVRAFDALSGILGNIIGSTRVGSALNATQFSKLVKLIGPIGGLLALLIGTVKLGLAGLKDRVANIQGKIAMGESDAFTDSAVSSMNSLNKISSKLKQTFEGLKSTAANLIIAFTSTIDKLAEKVESFDEWLGKGIYKLFNGTEEGYESYYESEQGKYNITGNELGEVENLIGIEGRKLGFDNASIKEMQKTIIERSAQLAQGKEGATTYDTAKTVISDIFSGTQDLAQYGIVVDDDVLAGWAALKKGIDIVNVSYSDAALAGLRYELVLEQMSKAGTKGLQDNIKMLKEQGALMQKNKNNVSQFEEVLKVSGYNEGIPDIIGDAVVGIGDANKGLSQLKDKLLNLNGYELEFVYDIYGGDVPEWVQEALTKSPDGIMEFFIKLGVIKDQGDIEAYAKMLQSRAEAPTILEVYAKYGGFTNMEEMQAAFDKLSQDQIDLLVQLNGIESVEELKELLHNISWEELESLKGQIDDVTYTRLVAMKNKMDEVEKAASEGFGQLEISATDFIKTFSTALLDHTEAIKNIIKAIMAALKGDWSGALSALGLTSSNLKKQDELNSEIDKIGNDVLSSQYDTQGRQAYTSTREYTDLQAYNSSIQGGDMNISLNTNYSNPNGYVPIASLIGHADGGISTSFHIAGISEGNKPEAIIPLSSSAANPAYEQIGRAVAMAMGGMNDSLSGGQTIINVAPNSTVIGDQAGLRKLAALMESNIALLKRDRGELDYGINK